VRRQGRRALRRRNLPLSRGGDLRRAGAIDPDVAGGLAGAAAGDGQRAGQGPAGLLTQRKIAAEWRFPIPFCMICIISYRTGASMADQTISPIAAAPRQELSPTVLQIAVLAALAATGTLAT